MSTNIADLAYHRVLRELELATRACEAATKRTKRDIRLLKKQTDERRRRIAEMEARGDWIASQSSVFVGKP